MRLSINTAPCHTPEALTTTTLTLAFNHLHSHQTFHMAGPTRTAANRPHRDAANTATAHITPAKPGKTRSTLPNSCCTTAMLTSRSESPRQVGNDAPTQGDSTTEDAGPQAAQMAEAPDSSMQEASPCDQGGIAPGTP